MFLAYIVLMVSLVSADSAKTNHIETQPTLYVVSCSHLDTQWYWTIQETINEHLPATFNQNFALFDKFPHYGLSFEGTFRYQLIREYYPEVYEKIKRYIAAGRWHVAGSSVDAGDVNIVCSESLIRHFLYGNNFFEDEFGKRSMDVFLPDCFGFGWQLPTIASHCGLKGFSTQKLGWGSAIPIPFDIGRWQGPDGGSLIAAINPGSYIARITSDLSEDADWLNKVNQQAQKTGLKVAYKYIGVGDAGGGLDQESAQWLEKSITDPNGPLKVINAGSDQLYRDLTDEQIARLPLYNGPLLLKTHGVGCYTSQAAMKRLNRKNELLANAAECAAVTADWVGGYDYPKETLTEAWTRFLWHQFHDDLTGTSIPRVYEFSWNDEFISLNQFSSTLGAAVENIARAMDTSCQGQSIVVYNPLSFAREDIVQAKIILPEKVRSVQVFDPEGNEVPSQILSKTDCTIDLIFLAKVPAVGFKIYDMRSGESRRQDLSPLNVTKSKLENSFYCVKINDNGDISSIYDKQMGRELLAEPIRLAMLHDQPNDWPAWEITWEDTAAAPKTHVADPAQIKVVEQGPVRVAVEVVRNTNGSTFKQRVSLSVGQAGNIVECDNMIDWRTDSTLLKATFPFKARSDKAAYDMGIGGIEYKTSHSDLYEVPGQQWADLADANDNWGAAIFNDCKYGWDKPNDNTLRLTLLHSPGPHQNFPLQTQLDFGLHKVKYAVYGHRGNWQAADLSHRSASFNQPMLAFSAEKSTGPMGKVFSLLSVDGPGLLVKAIKKAERSDEIIIRVHEVNGKSIDNAQIHFARELTSAREVNGVEQQVGNMVFEGSTIKTSFKPYQIRTVAVRLKESDVVIGDTCVKAVEIPFDIDVVSSENDMTDGGFDQAGNSIPAELWPEKVTYKGIDFKLGQSGHGQKNAIACKRQKILLPAGYNKLYLLASTTEDTHGTCKLNGTPHTLNISSYTGFIGQWETVNLDCSLRDGYNYKPGYLKKDNIAWIGTHRHTQNSKNEAYVFCYLFAYELDLGLNKTETTLTLPDNEHIRIAAMTLAHEQQQINLLSEIISQDDIINPIKIEPSSALFVDTINVAVSDPRPGAVLRYALDGKEPDENSPICKSPIRLDKTTLLRVKGYVNKTADEFSRGGKYIKQTPAEGLKTGQYEPGLNYSCYVGQWYSIPEFASMAAVKKGGLDRITVDVNSPDPNDYGLQIRGFIKIGQTGIHYFKLACDDGGVLYIAGNKVVNNDGRHGMNIVRDGFITLQQGVHPFTLDYFNGGGKGDVSILYRDPQGVEKPLNEILVLPNKP